MSLSTEEEVKIANLKININKDVKSLFYLYEAFQPYGEIDWYEKYLESEIKYKINQIKEIVESENEKEIL